MSKSQRTRALGSWRLSDCGQVSLLKYSENLLSLWLSPASRVLGPQKVVVFFHGLGDGLFCCGYLPALSSRLTAAGLHLVCPLTRSSYDAWRSGSLQNDSEDLTALLCFVRQRLGDDCSATLLGFSSGCQNAVHLMRRLTQRKDNGAVTDNGFKASQRNADLKAMVNGLILHAPVSDREYEQWSNADYGCTLRRAEALQSAGKGALAVGRSLVTANRWLALNRRFDTEDMFSSDFSDIQLSQRLAHCSSLPVLIVMCASDEFVPPHVDKRRLLRRMQRVIGADGVLLQNADHYISASKPQSVFVETVLRFLQKIATPKNETSAKCTVSVGSKL